MDLFELFVTDFWANFFSPGDSFQKKYVSSKIDNFNLEFLNNKFSIWNVPWNNSHYCFKILCLDFKLLDPIRDPTVRPSMVLQSEKHKSFLNKSYNMCRFRKISKYKLFETKLRILTPWCEYNSKSWCEFRSIFGVLLYQYQFELKCRLLMLPHSHCPLISLTF